MEWINTYTASSASTTRASTASAVKSAFLRARNKASVKRRQPRKHKPNRIQKLSSGIRRRIPGSIPFSFFRDVPETWPHFIDRYGRCNENLSNIERPECFTTQGFMAAPEAYNESKRVAAAKLYLHRKKWRDRAQLEAILSELSSEFQGVSVSIITREFQCVKYQCGLNMDQVSRNVSIDAHGLLSNGMFVLLDASQDWRMIYNPFVHGPPFIRFYAAVPLKTASNGLPIGVVAVFEPYSRTSVPIELELKLERASTEIMAMMDTQPSILSPRIETAEDCQVSTATIASSPCGGLTTCEKERFTGLLPTNCTVPNYMNSLKKLNRPAILTQSYQISKELSSCLSVRGAAERASKILADTLGLDFVYVVEIRISKTYEVASTLLQFANKMDVSMMGQELDQNVHTRLLGGLGIDGEEQFDAEIHANALMSPYGIQYDAPEEKLSFRSGIFMPFKRTDDRGSFTDGQNKVSGDENEIFRRFTKLSIKPDVPLGSEQPVRVKVRNGGYIMAGFCVNHRSFSPNDVEYMKNCVSALESAFT